MANTQLRVTRRTVLGKKVKALRRDGVTPANIYGHKLESLAVQAMTPEVTHALRTSSRNAIFDLTVEGDGGTRPAVVRDIHRDPVTGRILHIDFFQISMTEKMRADVRVVLTGTSPAVSTYGGVLLQTLDSVAVEALPGDIPPQFEIDVSTLTELEQSVHVRDLAFDAEKVTLHSDPDVVLARVATPRLATAEEEGAAPAEEAAEGAEGAEAAEGGEGAAEPSEGASS
jgi:large subunit ribosomal protein L25